MACLATGQQGRALILKLHHIRFGPTVVMRVKRQKRALTSTGNRRYAKRTPVDVFRQHFRMVEE